MRHKSFVAVVWVGFLVGASTALASDICVQLGGGGGYAVFKSPKIQLNCCPPDPAELNNCAPLNGVEAISPPPPNPPSPGLGGALTGTLCVDQQGNGVIYHYVYHNAVGLRESLKAYFESGYCRFKFGPVGKDPNSGITGTCRGTVITNPTPPGGSGTFFQSATLWKCDVPVFSANPN
ncbi:hypothetical protein [Methylocystis echinoides]|uniref:hypothetical protein n=1 Tax=Methylocystis echinoides TaxID=29468 RepID=UPI00342E4C27